MDGIKAFVDAICDYEDNLRRTGEIEEDQKLPSRDVLEEVCQILLNVSCMREEGRFPSFRVCYLRPDSELLDAYIYAHALLFKKPIEFNAGSIHKLAPALNPDMSYLMVDVSVRPFKAVGIIAAFTMWEKIMTGERVTGNRMPKIPNILVSGPGQLRACLGESLIVNYSAGQCVFFRTDTFTSTLVADQLAKNTSVSKRERLQLLYRVLWQVTNYGHGAAILIVPSPEACAGFIDLKYPMPGKYLFHDDARAEISSGKVREKEILTYADMIAKLTSVDGSVILTKDFDLVGFGAETLVDQMESRHPEMCFISYNNEVNKLKTFKDQGMRHRSAYRFCSAVEGSVAFIISQDGTIEACTKHDGSVVVYDNVALPLI